MDGGIARSACAAHSSHAPSAARRTHTVARPCCTNTGSAVRHAGAILISRLRRTLNDAMRNVTVEQRPRQVAGSEIRLQSERESEREREHVSERTPEGDITGEKEHTRMRVREWWDEGCLSAAVGAWTRSGARAQRLAIPCSSSASGTSSMYLQRGSVGRHAITAVRCARARMGSSAAKASAAGSAARGRAVRPRQRPRRSAAQRCGRWAGCTRRRRGTHGAVAMGSRFGACTRARPDGAKVPVVESNHTGPSESN